MNSFFQGRELALAGSQANQWFRYGGPDNPADRHGLVVELHKKDEQDLASPPGDSEVMEDDLAGHMNQGPEQPLVQDEVEEEEYHDALEA